MNSARLAGFTVALVALAGSAAIAAEAPSASFTVSSVDSRYPYYGLKGSDCPRGAFFVHARLAEAREGLAAGTTVVLRLVDAAGVTAGKTVSFADVKKAGAGPDGTAVFCAVGPGVAALPPPPLAEAPVSLADAGAGQTAASATEVSASAASAAKAPKTRCGFRSFLMVKEHLGGGRYGPTALDPTSMLSSPEASGTVACTVARSRATNVALLNMVKAKFEGPGTVVGAEWAPRSTWERVLDEGGQPTQQKRVVRVYVQEQAPELASAARR